MNVVNVVPMSALPPPPSPSGAPHQPVLLLPTLEALTPREGKVIVDATLGAGGHSEAMLAAGARVIGVDRDPSARELAAKRLEVYPLFSTIAGTFGQLPELLAAAGVGKVDGILADVGVSSMQLDEPARGMSFRHDGPLDMRMDPSSGETAIELIAELSDDELADVIYRFGEERRSRRIARCIKQALSAGELSTTSDLRRAVVRAVGPARVGGIDPSTRTFQALRIAVNAELDQLSALLEAAPRLLVSGGTLAVISFHSLEDRLVKRAFADRGLWSPRTKKPIVATDEEAKQNPRSRSAKLRAATRLDDDPGFEEESP